MAATIIVQNRQRSVRFDLRWVRQFADVALESCRARPADRGRLLEAVAEVEVAIVSDPVIAQVHEQFMGIQGPTDVITFEHGEIVISAQTAAANARCYRRSIEEEIALYTVHGLLHLNGFQDTDSREAARMRKVQNRIFKACLKKMPLCKLLPL